MGVDNSLREIIGALEKPLAYPHPTENIKRIITGASVVFLTGTKAYKLNKPVNLGFLDFSTLEKENCNVKKSIVIILAYLLIFIWALLL